MDRLLGEHGIPQDSAAGRREFAVRMEQRRTAELEPEWQLMRRGWCVGSEEFRQELLARMSGKVGVHHSGPERKASAEAHAQQVLEQQLQRLGWKSGDLTYISGASAAKLDLAARLRRETTMPIWWIAQQLGYHSWKYLSNELYLRRKHDNIRD